MQPEPRLRLSHEHTKRSWWGVGSDSRWPPPDSRRRGLLAAVHSGGQPPSTSRSFAETHGAPSTPRASDDMRTRSGAGKNMIGIMAFRHEVRPPELSRQRLRLVAQPGDGRGATTTTPLPRTGIIIDDRRTPVEYQHSPRALGPFNGPKLQSLQRRQVRA
jgi:hypothetical protein